MLGVDLIQKIFKKRYNVLQFIHKGRFWVEIYYLKKIIKFKKPLF